MSKILNPPTSLDHLVWFVVRYNRNSFTYELVVPTTRQTFMLGNAFKTRAYFKQVGLEELGGRGMDMAKAFVGAQVLVKENRAWGLDVTDIKIDEATGRLDKLMDFERLLGGDDSEDDEIGMIL